MLMGSAGSSWGEGGFLYTSYSWRTVHEQLFVARHGKILKRGNTWPQYRGSSWSSSVLWWTLLGGFLLKKFLSDCVERTFLVDETVAVRRLSLAKIDNFSRKSGRVCFAATRTTANSPLHQHFILHEDEHPPNKFPFFPSAAHSHPLKQRSIKTRAQPRPYELTTTRFNVPLSTIYFLKSRRT